MRKFKAFKFMLVTLVLALFACAGMCAPAEAIVYITAEKSFNVYAEDDSTTPAKTLPAGTKVMLDSYGGSGEIFLTNSSGTEITRWWINVPDLFKTSSILTTTKEGLSYWQPYETLRETPIPKGTEITVYYQCNNGWCFGKYKQGNGIFYWWFKLSDVSSKSLSKPAPTDRYEEERVYQIRRKAPDFSRGI